MNQIKIFTNPIFGDVRTLQDKYNNPWFVGLDVAKALGYSNTRDALIRHIEDDDKASVGIHDGRQKREMTLINEAGLYSLILSSKLPQAKEFKHWITREVIPSIRKNGGYIYNQEEMSEKELLAKALEVVMRINEENKSKVIFAESLLGSDDSILIGNLAKILRQNGINIGRNRLFHFLREAGFLMKPNGEDYNLPTQKSVDMGLMEIKENVYFKDNKEPKISLTTKITSKGQEYFISLFLDKD